MPRLLRHLRARLFRTRPSRFIRDEQGATAVEYAVMLALILLVTLASIVAVGNATSNSWSDTNTKMSAAGLGS
jgi:pilus assembly protein Flp/PilA